MSFSAPLSLRVIPVIDLKQGHAVHAVGGERAHYQPVRSILHAGSDPIGLARAFRDRLDCRDLYLADLDAISGGPPAVRVYRELTDLGLHVWVDPGVRDANALPPLLEACVGSIVVGLETVRGPAALAAILALVGPERVVFSLDLKAGRALVAEGTDWGSGVPLALAFQAARLGVRRLLLLDLSRVGRGQGVGTRPLLEELKSALPALEITVGGGIAGMEDLAQLTNSGASAVLVGSALHDGRISAADLKGGSAR